MEDINWVDNIIKEYKNSKLIYYYIIISFNRFK